MVADGYKDTEIGVIPIEWEVVKVGNILNVQTGKMNAQDQVNEGEYPFFTRSIDVQTIDTYAYDTEALFIAGEGNFKVKYYNGKFNCHQRTYMLTSINDNNMKFLLNAIQPKVNKLIATSVGSTVQSLRKPIIEALKIPLPPLKEQEKIADILSTADEKIDAIASQIEKAQTLKKGLLQKLLSEGINHCEFKDSELGKIPESWEVVELPHITDKITSGGTPSRKKVEYFENGTVNWIKTGELRDCYIYNSKEKITEDAVANSSAKVFPIDTLLIAMYGATIGRTAYLKTECSTNQACCAIIFNKSIADPYFYWKYFHFIKDDLISQGRGAGQPNISQSIIKTLLIPFPPLKEQKQIADILSTADEKLEVLRAKKDKFETLKKGLLQKLLSGEIRV
ncbi:MAG: restriction endonuclease subunit S [Sulfurimonas sp.]|nr:restriction endonuclease subunit S [Sulfurimonas sp.]